MAMEPTVLTSLKISKSQETLALPDIFEQLNSEVEATLDKVGMQSVQMPIRMRDQKGQSLLIPAEVDIFVSLDDKEAKGIHMSRLYRELESFLPSADFSIELLKDLLSRCVETQKGLSHSGYIRIAWTLPVERRALKSDLIGWRNYPVVVEARLNGTKFEVISGAEVLYSSTCPCSAALARQLNQEKFRAQFSGRKALSAEEVIEWLGREESMGGVPHAQRSRALFKVRSSNQAFSILDLIDLVEEALGTPVQTAVKREDEQEFARLNATHLMFCEDAARRVVQAFEQRTDLTDYYIRVEHQESLHPHNAVAETTKGIAGGWSS